MPKKSKLKCPQCKSKDIADAHHDDCPSCSCVDIYECQKCWCQFDKNGEEV